MVEVIWGQDQGQSQGQDLTINFDAPVKAKIKIFNSYAQTETK